MFLIVRLIHLNITESSGDAVVCLSSSHFSNGDDDILKHHWLQWDAADKYRTTQSSLQRQSPINSTKGCFGAIHHEGNEKCVTSLFLPGPFSSPPCVVEHPPTSPLSFSPNSRPFTSSQQRGVKKTATWVMCDVAARVWVRGLRSNPARTEAAGRLLKPGLSGAGKYWGTD